MNHSRKTNVEYGAFPFPILDGPEESRYLTWIRNHSNYMAVRGILDYVRAVSVLIRGVLINSMIFLPWLLMMAVLMAAHSNPGYRVWIAGLVLFAVWAVAGVNVAIPLFTRVFGWRPPASIRIALFVYTTAVIVAAIYIGVPTGRFPLTMLVVVFGVSWTLLSALGTPFFRISVYRRTLMTGSDSSVKARDAFERSFGGFFVAFVLAAGFESLAFFLPVFHDWVGGFGWPAVGSSVAFGVGVLGAAQNSLSMLRGGAKRLAIVAVGLVGLLVPIGAVLVLTVLMRFNLPLGSSLITIALGLVPFGVAFAVLSGGRAFSGGEKGLGCVGALVLWIGLVFLAGAGVGAAGAGEEPWGDELENLAGVLAADSAALNLVVDAVVAKDRSRLADLRRYLVQDSSRARVERALQADTMGLRDQIEPLFAAGPVALARALATASEAELLVAHPYLGCSDIRFQLWLNFGEPPPDDETRVDLGCKLRAVRWEVAAFASFWPDAVPGIYASEPARNVRQAVLFANARYALSIAILLWLLTWLAVDINRTSIHGLYRDRLAAAFLVGEDTVGDVDIEEDLNLADICRYDLGSTAPYHLINVALNLQGTKDMSVRDRKSDFFIFSKNFIGGARTGYCRSETMEGVFPEMSLGTAMAISAAAAAPNMGQATNPGLVAIMTLLNIRLGFWVPRPGALVGGVGPGGYAFAQHTRALGSRERTVFEEELEEIQRRRRNLGTGSERGEPGEAEPGALMREPTVENDLVGIAFSGGGIRSATVNLGITQALDRHGIFEHADYMSTVSGGGYLGSSISALMRQRIRTTTEVSGIVEVEETDDGKILRIPGPSGDGGATAPAAGLAPRSAVYRYPKTVELAVTHGEAVVEGQRLIAAEVSAGGRQGSYGRLFRWRVRPILLLREILGRPDETQDWVNVSDGGHIENLAGIELLRRRCKYIILGDGEADPDHHFTGLATLIRFARIDLGTEIDIKPDGLRLGADRVSKSHWATGTITYPALSPGGKTETGYLLYLKSSINGDEDEVIRQYRESSEDFPHESTADQFFGEGQFEAYRSLGEHIGESVIEHGLAYSSPTEGNTDATDPDMSSDMSYGAFERWFKALVQNPPAMDRQFKRPHAVKAKEWRVE